MALLVGLDIGSTTVKALVFDADARRVRAVGQAPTVVVAQGGGSAFEPAAIWASVVRALRQALAGCDAHDIAGVAVASMGEAGVPLDAAGQPTYPAITWYDRRSEEFLPWWTREVGVERAERITGQVLHHMYSALKLQWLRQHEPAIWARTRRWLCMEEFIAWRLSGVAVTDHSIASRTLLFDQAKGDWSEALLSATELPRSLFPEAAPSGTAFGAVTADAAAATGLPAGTPVVTGGHDHLVGALAAGAARPGVLLDSAGTAEGILLTATRYDPSPALLSAGFSIYRHVVPGRFVVVAGQHGAGGLITWLIDRLYGAEGARPYERAFAEAAAAPVGAGGLFCLPHLRGSRVPEHDLQSRAAFVGLVDGHGRGHLLRAALESLGYWLASSLAVLEAATGDAITELLVIGGATRSPLWMQIKADCTNRTLRLPRLDEAVALGAALLAGVGVGVYADADAAAAAVAVDATVVQPNPATAAQYARARAVYAQLHPALQGVNRAILALREGPAALTVL